jgi:transcriptional regulator of arginine metabolism
MPTSPESQTARRETILALLRKHRISRQSELVSLLADRGHDATQSSVSRDLREMGVTKIGARYRLPDDDIADAAFTSIAGFVRGWQPAGPYLLVLHTTPGAAQGVAVALDDAGWTELVGTVSGDDTIFLATATETDQRRLTIRLAGAFPR